MTDLQQFLFAAAQDVSAAADNTTIFVAGTRIQVVEVGMYVTTDIVAGAADVEVFEFDITSASLGVTASEVTAPTRGSYSARLITPTTSVTIQDGKIVSAKCDFTMEKGELLTAECSGTATSGNATPYILYRCAGQSAKEAGEQRSNSAVE